MAKSAEATPEDILSSAGLESKGGYVKQLTPIQQAGLQLLAYIGAAIVLTIVFVCIDWLRLTPPAPSSTATRDVIDNYKDMRSYASDDASKLFDTIVSKALLPVFTTVLGYIFGSRAVASTSE